MNPWKTLSGVLVFYTVFLVFYFHFKEGELYDTYSERVNLSFHHGYNYGYIDGKAETEENCSNQISLIESENSLEVMDLKTKIHSLERKISALEQSKPLFQVYAEKVANAHEYSIPDYVCENFTSDLVKVLRALGYDAKKIKGYTVNCNPDSNPYGCRHVWTRIDGIMIESVTGEVLNPDYYKENYRESEWT